MIKTISRILVTTITLGGINSVFVNQASAQSEKAVLAGGCFWCIEKDFEHVNGVIDVISGYTGGTTPNPTYRNHSAGKHLEAVQITYDPQKISYKNLLEIFWRSVNPTDAGGQFCDRGYSYTTAIYATSKEQLETAKASKAELQKSGAIKGKIVTPILAASKFYPSEDYHQNYYKKNPVRYKYYRYSCGRNQTVKQLWGKQAYKGINYDT
jgi:peptide-methionine (S)-S-oxide reductase